MADPPTAETSVSSSSASLFSCVESSSLLLRSRLEEGIEGAKEKRRRLEVEDEGKKEAC
jgi:hypothetical protein